MRLLYTLAWLINWAYFEADSLGMGVHVCFLSFCCTDRISEPTERLLPDSITAKSDFHAAASLLSFFGQGPLVIFDYVIA